LKSAAFFGNDGLHLLDFLQPQANPFIDAGLQVVKVVEMHSGDARRFRFNVSGQGDIDQQERAAGALLYEGFEHLDGDERARGCSGTDNDIGFKQRFA